MECRYACHAPEHAVSRRSLLAAMLGGSAGLAGLGHLTGMGQLVRPAVAQELARQQKRVLIIFLSGGASQLETWDPKPGTDTGGPFRAIPTSVPGVHISELLPYSAQQMHHLTLVRSVNTAEDDHGKGAYFIETGRRDIPGLRYPMIGSAMSKFLAPADAGLPGYVYIGSGGYNKAEAAFLGAQFASVGVGDGQAPPNLVRPDSLSESADRARQVLRQRFHDRFTQRRRTAETEAYSFSFEQAQKLMAQRDVFDLSQESQVDQDRYGTHSFGRHCLLARRLLERGVTCVKVSHSNYDTHFENFDFHIEQLGEFDRAFATLIQDLAERGLLDSTLVAVISEFGRTPNINAGLGRDHWGHAWSVCLAGCGLQRGAAYGATNENGTAVADGEVHGGHLFHTYFNALGVDSSQSYELDGQPIPIADPSAHAIREILA